MTFTGGRGVPLLSSLLPGPLASFSFRFGGDDRLVVLPPRW
jgi:hypothetical protein